MSLAEEPIFLWMSQFAYQPYIVYGALVGMMLLSAVGFPLPEEVTLLTVGLLAFFGRNPDLFPPPYPGAPVVDMYTAMIIATVAVLAADVLVFLIGRWFGPTLLRQKWIQKIFPPHHQKTIEEWTQKYGSYTCAIFRFTPGVRFPGHLAYGMMKFSIAKFVMIDGIAVLVSVPTQIFLMATFGEQVLGFLRQFKIAVFSLIGVLLLYFAIRALSNRRKRFNVPQ